jgi:hypothetical protein
MSLTVSTACFELHSLTSEIERPSCTNTTAGVSPNLGDTPAESDGPDLNSGRHDGHDLRRFHDNLARLLASKALGHSLQGHAFKFRGID